MYFILNIHSCIQTTLQFVVSKTSCIESKENILYGLLDYPEKLENDILAYC